MDSEYIRMSSSPKEVQNIGRRNTRQQGSGTTEMRSAEQGAQEKHPARR